MSTSKRKSKSIIESVSKNAHKKVTRVHVTSIKQLTTKQFTIKQLNLLANSIRQDIIRMLVAAGSGHPGGALGMTDVFTALYFNALKHDPKKPDWQERDRLVLSNGHICPAHYATLAHAGYFPVKELLTLRKLGSRLQGHPHRTSLPGIETTSGPLGSGLSQAAGMALAAKMDNTKQRFYCLTSDGEHDEGQTWEAVMFCVKYKLDNLVCIIDRNNIQIDGNTEDIMPLESLKKKYESFGWRVLEIDGHNMLHILDALHKAATVHQQPTVILAHTIPGKGVSFMENNFAWHGIPPTQKQAMIALAELQKARTKIMSRAASGASS